MTDIDTVTRLKERETMTDIDTVTRLQDEAYERYDKYMRVRFAGIERTARERAAIRVICDLAWEAYDSLSGLRLALINLQEEVN